MRVYRSLQHIAHIWFPKKFEIRITLEQWLSYFGYCNPLCGGILEFLHSLSCQFLNQWFPLAASQVWISPGTVFSVQWAVVSVQCAVCNVKCEVCSVQCVVCSMHCRVGSVQCSVCSVQCAVLSVQCADCSMQCPVSSVQSLDSIIMYIVQCSVCSEHWSVCNDCWKRAFCSEQCFNDTELVT